MPGLNIRVLMEKRIFIADRQNIFRFRHKVLHKIVEKFFEMKKVSFSLSLVLTDNQLIKKLNYRYRKENYSTDVLAFPLAAEYDLDDIRGEIVISVEKAQENAILFAQRVEKEIALYLVHGLLHLLGYRDYPTQVAEEMRREEKKILRSLDKELFDKLLIKKI